ncbi:MAG: hypothetical protein KGJ80_03345 [Chloroflexota bacterium]|nr:hypothetical protein [Chloroflexota bacterium]
MSIGGFITQFVQFFQRTAQRFGRDLLKVIGKPLDPFADSLGNRLVQLLQIALGFSGDFGEIHS